MSAEWVAVILAGTGMLCGMVAWLFNVGIRPLKQVIENNTDALTLALTTLGKHDSKLDDHEIRLNTIETTHEILGCARKGVDDGR